MGIEPAHELEYIAGETLTLGGMTMIRAMLVMAALVAVALPAWAVIGDLDLNGQVDFGDFFILADNFGKKGPPDTLRVVRVVDTIQVTHIDTQFLQGPVPTKSPIADVESLLDGYWHTDVYHDVRNISLADGQPKQRYRMMRITSAAGSKIYMRWYLKPGGQLLQEEVYRYSVIRLSENIYAFYGDFASDRNQSTRYFYDSTLTVSGAVRFNARDLWDDTRLIDTGVTNFATWAYPHEGGEGYLAVYPEGDSTVYAFSWDDRKVVEDFAPPDDHWKWSKAGIDWDVELSK